VPRARQCALRSTDISADPGVAPLLGPIFLVAGPPQKSFLADKAVGRHRDYVPQPPVKSFSGGPIYMSKCFPPGMDGTERAASLAQLTGFANTATVVTGTHQPGSHVTVAGDLTGQVSLQTSILTRSSRCWGVARASHVLRTLQRGGEPK